MRIKRIGIVTAGGDCPGLNAVIRAVTRHAIADHGLEVVGIHDGFGGLLRHASRRLLWPDVAGILALGGTILGASNRDNPFRVPVGENHYEDHSDRAVRTIEALRLDALLCAGGDGTMHIAQGLADKGMPVIGIPKTIDNDLDGTDQTFGFDTAAAIIADAIVDLHTTAEAHHRVMLVETMGRYAGWLALAGGLAGAANVILIPEIPFAMERVVDYLSERRRRGKKASIVAVAEGARPAGGERVVKALDPNRTDPVQLGGIAYRLAWQIEQLGGPECRVVVLGHLQRAGRPSNVDRLLATRLGVKAVELAVSGRFGQMAALQGGAITSVAIADTIHKLRLVPADHPLIHTARAVGTHFGD